MSAEHVHHKIAAFQQQLETLHAATAHPGLSQGVVPETLQAFHEVLEELHAAAAALRDSEARSSAIVQTAVDGIIMIDEEGLIESCNPAAERLFGYAADEVIGHNIRLLMPAPYREEHDGYLARYRQTGDPRIIGIGREVRGLRKDSTTFPMALAVSEVRLADRRLFTGIVHDLSARVHAEEALHYQAQLLELSYEPIFVWDLEQGIVLWNQGCERLYGFTKAEALGRVSHALLHTVHPMSLAVFHAVLLREQQWTGEVRHTTRDGREVIVESRQQLIEHDGRRLVLETNRDITARTQAEAALRDSEARHHAIFQTAVDGIITIDEDGLIESCNPAAERLFGYRADEVIGHNIRLLMPAPYREEHDGYLARYRQTGDPRIIGIGREVRGLRKDGTTFPMALAVSEIFLGRRRIFTGIVHDLTARVQVEEALRHARDELEVRVKERTAELEAANEEVRRFAYIVSHDLRAPLVNLKGFSSELRTATHVLQDVLPAVLPHLEAPQHADIVRALDQDIPEALGFIETSVTRMDHLIRAILHLSRLGRRELDVERLDTRALVQETVQTLAHQIAARQVQVTVDALPTVMADRTAMEQIMGNLLVNAVAYLVPGRPGEIVVTGERQPDVTVFHVRDNGRGIAKDDIPKIFEPFRRVGRQDVPGEGMGLAYVQMLVRRHGGEIRCHSTLGVGTTLTFTIAHQIAEGDAHAG